MASSDSKPPVLGLPAAEWLSSFRSAKVEIERLDAAKSARSRATIIGNFLARMLDREVPIEVDGRAGKATLRKSTGRARAKLYFFEVAFDDGGSDEPPSDGFPKGDDTRVASGKRVRKLRTPPDAESRENPLDRRPTRTMVPTGNDEAW